MSVDKTLSVVPSVPLEAVRGGSATGIRCEVGRPVDFVGEGGPGVPVQSTPVGLAGAFLVAVIEQGRQRG